MKIFLVPSKLASSKFQNKIELLYDVLRTHQAGVKHAVTTASTDSDFNEEHASEANLVVFAITKSTVWRHRGDPANRVRPQNKLIIGRGVYDINRIVCDNMSDDELVTEAVVVFVDEESDSRAHFNAYRMPHTRDFRQMGSTRPSGFTKDTDWNQFAWCDWEPNEIGFPALLQWQSPEYRKRKGTVPPKKTRLAVACRYLRKAGRR